jgi:hypothetical protein
VGFASLVKAMNSRCDCLLVRHRTRFLSTSYLGSLARWACYEPVQCKPSYRISIQPVKLLPSICPHIEPTTTSFSLPAKPLLTG